VGGADAGAWAWGVLPLVTLQVVVAAAMVLFALPQRPAAHVRSAQAYGGAGVAVLERSRPSNQDQLVLRPRGFTSGPAVSM